MLSQRWRPVVITGVVLVAIWVIAMIGYAIARHSTVTAEKVTNYVAEVDLSKLSPAERAKAIRRLADMLNSLPAEERRRTRIERTSGRWFEQMTEEEKGTFIEATMPT